MTLKHVAALLLFTLVAAGSRPAPGAAPEGLRAAARENRESLRLHTYMTVNTAMTLAGDPEQLEASVETFHRLGIQTIILEVYRSGVSASTDDLTLLRDYYVSQDFGVMGGIATVPGGDFGVAADSGLTWFNWQAEKTQHDLEAVMRRTAPLFSRFVIDDFLCTGDLSALSDAARGARSWGDYRRDLLVGLSQKLFAGPAREENPDITMVIKYPQWYDRFHEFGYDVARSPQLFDEVWVGTETRDARTQRFGFTQPYEGFFNYRWIASIAGNKVTTAWFDHGDCQGPEFVDQAWQSVLAGAKDLVFFSAASLLSGHPGHDLILRDYAHLAALADAVSRHPVTGVASYKPPISDAAGDLYVNDFIGMLGVPLVPVSRFPLDAANIFLPAQAGDDPQIVQRVGEALMAGKNVVVTAGLIAKVQERDLFAQLAGISAPPAVEPFRANELALGDGRIAFEAGLDLESRFSAATADVLLAVYEGDTAVPFLTRHQVGLGTLHVLNSHTFSQEDFDAVGEVLLSPRDLGLLYLPNEWTGTIRAAFGGASGVAMRGPSRITLQPLGSAGWVLQNYNEASAAVQLDFEETEELRILLHGEPREFEGGALTLEIAPRSRVWLVRGRE